MAKVKWRAREFNPTANMEGRSHSFYAEAMINSDLSNFIISRTHVCICVSSSHPNIRKSPHPSILPIRTSDFASKIDADSEGVEFIGTDAAAEGGQEVVGERQSCSCQRAAAYAHMRAELPGVEDIDLLVGALPTVVVVHDACCQASADVVHD